MVSKSRCFLQCVFVAGALASLTPGGAAPPPGGAPPPPGAPKPYLAGAECGVAVGDSVSELVLASTHLYRSIVDCSAAIHPGDPHNPHRRRLEDAFAAAQGRGLATVPGLEKDKHTFLCTADIFELVAGAALTSKYAINIFGFCFDMHVQAPQCVRSALELTAAVAETVAAVNEIKVGCVDHLARDPSARKLHAAKCVVDIKKITKNSVDVLAEASLIKSECEHSQTACTAGIFKGISSLAAVAEYLFGAFHDCGSEVPTNTECGENIAKLVSSLADIAAHAITVRYDCGNHSHWKTPPTSVSTIANQFGGGWNNALDAKKTKDNLATLVEAVGNLKPRKYDAKVGKVGYPSASAASSFTTTLLFGAIPVALALGFYGGRRTRANKVSTLRAAAEDEPEVHSRTMSTNPLMGSTDGPEDVDLE